MIRRFFSNSSTANSNSTIPLSLHSFPFTSPSNPISHSPIIFLHGLLGNSLNWRSIGQKFPEYRTYGIDLRNHGNSPHHLSNSYIHQADDIHYWIQNQSQFHQQQPIHLIGHSMGAKVAMTFALKFPHLIRSLTIIDMTPYNYSMKSNNKNSNTNSNGNSINTSKNIDNSHDKSNEDWNGVKNVLNSMRSVQFHGIENREEITKQLMKTIQDPVLRGFLLQNIRLNTLNNNENNLKNKFEWRINLPVLYKFLESGEAAEFPFHQNNNNKNNNNNSIHSTNNTTSNTPLLTFSGPTKFIGGTLSNYIQPAYYSSMKLYFPQYELNMIDGADHWVHFSKPMELIGIIKKFIENSEKINSINY